jgi:hypothetical protein
MTPKKKRISLSEAASVFGRAGGKSRLTKMTAEQRRAIAQMGGLARQKRMTEKQREELAASGGKASKGVPKKRKDKQS